MQGSWFQLEARESRDFKGSKTTAHPLLLLDGEPNEGVDTTVGKAITIPLPYQTRNKNALNRAERRREVLATYRVDEGPVLSRLLKESGEVLSETQELTMKLQRMAVDAAPEGEPGRRGVGQTQLIYHVERMDAEIKVCWERGEKVKALRIAIQACKMLGQTTVPESYPSFFILAAQVLDTFGDFVADRLQQTAASTSTVVATLLRKGQIASVDVIPPEAVEMCNNWFLKISSIRELLPRIYVELSLVKCYHFVAKKARVNMKETVQRLGRQIRGVGNPVVAAHVRWYLFLRAAEVLSGESWALCLVQTTLDCMVTLDRYCHYHLVRPALQWMFDTLAAHGGAKKQSKIVAALFQEALGDSKSDEVKAMLCHGIAKAFAVHHVLPNLPTLLQVAAAVENQSTLYIPLMETLCYLLCEVSDPRLQRKDRTGILRSVWTQLVQPRSPTHPGVKAVEFVQAVGALMRYSAKHLGVKQLNTLLQELRSFVVANQSSHGGEEGPSESDSAMEEAAFEAINGIIMNMDISVLLDQGTFLAAVGCLPGDLQRRIAMYILETLPKNTTNRSAVLELCRVVHDGVEDMLHGSGKESIAAELGGECISNAIRMCSVADPEVYLGLLCECRHSLPRLDSVKSTLIHEALKTVHNCSRANTATDTDKKKWSQRRTGAKACLAFAHVTAPAIKDIFSRLKHLVISATTGFQHGYVLQGEALLQLAVQTLAQISPIEWFEGATRDNDNATADIAQQVIAAGLLAPPHHKYGSLYIVDAILQWVDSHPWPERSVTNLHILLTLLRGTAHVYAEGTPCWKTAAMLNESEDFASVRAEKCTAVLKALADAMSITENVPGKAAALGMASVEILDALIPLADTTQSSLICCVMGAAHKYAMLSGVGTVDFVRRFQLVASFGKETLGESQWAIVLEHKEIDAETPNGGAVPMDDEEQEDEDEESSQQKEVVHVDPQQGVEGEDDRARVVSIDESVL